MASTYPTYKLGEIAKIYNGNSINAEEKEKKYKGVDGRNYIGTKDIEFDCSVNYSNGVRIPFDEKKFKIAPAGSVLVCAEGGSAGKKSAFITEDVCFGNKLFAITNNQGLFDGKYVFHYTRYKRFFDLFKNELSGLIGGVSSKKFGEIPIPLPPLPTQRAIVTRIESLFAELDKGVEKLKTAQQQLKVYRQAVLNDCLTKQEWPIVNIIDIVEKGKNALKAGPFGSALKKDCYVEKGYKIYGQEQVINGNPFIGNYYVDETKYKELESCKIQEGDILISLVGTVGKVLILPKGVKEGIINPRLIKITLNQQIYDAKFFKYYFESSKVKSFYKINASGTTMDVLNIGIIKQIPFPLPSLPEQQRIVQEIETRLSACDEVEKNIAESLQQAEALRQSILKKAFSGELV